MKIATVEKPLYHVYPGQFKTQGVYIQIDPETETISMDWNAEIGNAVPVDVWHNRILRYTLSVIPTVQAANELMEKIAPLAERIVAGHSTEWDGHNHVGQLNDDAQEASEELERIADQPDGDEQLVWDWDYCYEGCKEVMRADATDDEINLVVEEIEAMAADEGAILDFDLADRLLEIRYEKKEEEA